MFHSMNTLCVETCILYHIHIILYLRIRLLYPKSLELCSFQYKLEWTSILLCLDYIVNHFDDLNTIFLVYAYSDTSELILLLFFHSLFQLIPDCVNNRLMLIIVIIMTNMKWWYWWYWCWSWYHYYCWFGNEMILNGVYIMNKVIEMV